MMELLRQTFAALDRANRELGYVHRFAGPHTLHPPDRQCTPSLPRRMEPVSSWVPITGLVYSALGAACTEVLHALVPCVGEERPTPIILSVGCRDMRVGNIMEHRPEGELMLPEGFGKGKKKRNAFKLPGARTEEHNMMCFARHSPDVHLAELLRDCPCRRQAAGGAEVRHH